LDFGIATVLGDPSGEASTDHRFMTPAYASPEQIRGEAVTTATDVHALGVLLYELLTERHPFLDADPDDPTAVTDRIDQRRAPRPSRIAQASRGRRLRGDLDAIVDKALRKEPSARYPSAAQLADDLRRHLEHRPVLARRPTWAYLGGRLVRRHRLGSALAAVLLVVILGSAGLAVHLWRQAVSEQTRAEEVAEFLEDLYQLPDPRRDEGATVTALELLRRSAGSLEHELEDQPADRAALLLAIGSAYRGLGQHEQAARFLRRGLDLRARTGSGMDRRRLAGLLDLAAVERARGRRHAADTAFDAAAVALAAGGVDHPRLARHLNNHASLLEWEGDFRRAETLHRQALAMKERLLGGEHEDVATGWNNLATTLLRQGKLDEAERLYRDALAARLRLFGGESPRTLSTHNNLAVVLRDRGELVEAEAMLRDNLDARRRRLGDAHPALGTVLNNLAMCRQAAGDLAEAAALYQQVQELFDDAYGPDHVNAAIVRRNRSTLALAEGDASAATDLARAAVETFRAQLGDAHWRVADAESLLGAGLAAQGESATAIDVLRRSADRLEAAKGALARETVEARARLARWASVGEEEG
ncbi:MAG: tetratricopeptide repeat-containing protein kinase family protein, partial [Acidobacteriota bacterium]